jgi:hypothetical protein
MKFNRPLHQPELGVEEASLEAPEEELLEASSTMTATDSPALTA